jgi:uncharacterized membrane protein YidH (DUF202 family)
MTAVVLLLSLFVAVMGVLALLTPRFGNALAEMFRGGSGLCAATAIRLALGGGLLFVAESSRAPTILRLLGGFILLVGVITPLIGLQWHHRMIDWWLSAGTTVQRVWGTVALALGVFVIYAILK